MPRLATRDYLTTRQFLVTLWDRDDGFRFSVLPGHAQRDLHDHFVPTVPLSDPDAVLHRRRMTNAFPSLPQKADRAAEALRANLEGRPNQTVERTRAERTRVFKIGGKFRALRADAVSRPQIDTHYLAKALMRLVDEDDGTLMKKALKLKARDEKLHR